MQKPKVEHIERPVAGDRIEQKTTSKTPRSTVGTVTEIYDYLRILFARLGQPHCPDCDIPIGTQTADEIIDKVLSLPGGHEAVPDGPGRAARAGEVRDAVGRDPPGRATSACASTARRTASTSRRRSTAAASTRSKWSSTASSSAATAAAGIADAVEAALDLGKGVMHVAHVDDDAAGAAVAGRASTASTSPATSAAAASSRSTRTTSRSTARSAGARRAKAWASQQGAERRAC